MTTTLNDLPRTIHLPTDVPTADAPAKKSHKGLRLSDLRAGDVVRIARLSLSDQGCRKRFAEMGLAEGAKVHVLSAGETMMLGVGSSRMAVGAKCAESILVIRG